MTDLRVFVGEYHHEIEGDAWALLWYTIQGELYAIEPYADTSEGVRFYNRIAGEELEEFLEGSPSIYVNSDELTKEDFKHLQEEVQRYEEFIRS